MRPGNQSGGNGAFDDSPLLRTFTLECDTTTRSAKRRPEVHRLMQSPLTCPQCQKTRIVRDGHRYPNGEDIQRFVCKNCGFRFSEPVQGIIRDNKSRHGGDNPHEEYILSLRAVSSQGAGDKPTTELKTVGGDKKTSKTTSDFGQQLMNDGKSESTIRNCCNLIERLESKGIDPLKPEQVKQWLAEQK